MDANATLQLLIKATDQTGPVLSGVGGRVKTLADGIEGFTQPFADLADKILAIDAAVGTALLALGGFSIKNAGDFQTGVNEILTLLDDKKVDFKEFRDDLAGYFAGSSQTMESVLDAAYQAISQGIPPEVLTAFLDSAEKLATAGGSTLTEAVNLLAGTANAYGGTIDDVAGYADTFFTTVKDGKTTIPELAGAVGRVTALAAPFGLSVNDIAAAIAALTAYGVPSTNEAATILIALIQGLVKPTGDAAEAANGLGLSLGADVFQNTTLAGVLKEIGDKSGYSAGTISELFTSTEALKGALPLINDPAGTFQRALDDIATSAGAVDDAYRVMVDNADLLHQRLVNSLKTVLIDIGTPLLDDYAEAVTGLDGLFDAIDLGLKEGSFDPLIAVFEELLGDVGTLAQDIAGALPDTLKLVDFNGLADDFRDLADAVVAMLGMDGMDLSDPEELADVIQGVVDTLGSLLTTTEGITLAFAPLIGTVLEIIDEYNQFNDQEKSDFGNKILGQAKLIQDIGIELTAVLGLIQTFDADARTVTSVAIDAVMTLVEGARMAVEAVATGAAGTLATILGGLNTITFGSIPGLDTLVDDLNDIADRELLKFTQAWDRGAEHISDLMGNTAGEVAEEVEKIPDAAETASDKMTQIEWDLDPAGNIKGTVSEIKDNVEKLPGIVTPVAADLAAKTSGIFDEALDASENFRLKMEGIASNERIKTMEFSVDLQIAALEADRDKVLAVFGSIDNAITSTGNLMSTLVGALGNENLSQLEKWNLEDLLEEENRRREEEFRLQQEVTNTQLELMKLSKQRLENGDASIKVGLDASVSPALEAVLQEFVKHLQVWVNESEEALLLMTTGGGA